MGEFIKVIRNGIDVKRVVDDLKTYPNDWDHQKNIKNSKSLVDSGYDDLPISNLQLIMGGVTKNEEFVGDSEICIKTEAYKNHKNIRKLIRKLFGNVVLKRCGFLLMPVNGFVGAHIDEGTYYLNKDRYHLSISGKYQYFVGNENLIVNPGTLFWFNNKMPHGAVNISDEDRITFVFDILQSPKNPQNNIN